MNQYNAVVLHLEDIVSDGFADAVSGALREVDLDPHHYSDLEGLHNAGVVLSTGRPRAGGHRRGSTGLEPALSLAADRG
jgi:hypothetical protein